MCRPNQIKTSENATVTSESEFKTHQEEGQQSSGIANVEFYGAISLALIIAGFSLTMPHLQGRRDELKCDSFCLGSMTSARSALSLVGSFFVTRLSDSDSSFVAKTLGGGSGRKACLYLGTAASVVGLMIGGLTFSIRGMYLSMIPGSLFQQNFNVLKSLIADHHSSSSSTSASERAGSVGKLGMAVGIAFMIGPICGATLINQFEHAVCFAIILTLASMVVLSKVPAAQTKTKKDKPFQEEQIKNKGNGGSLMSFLNVKAARSPPALLLMAMRVCMALAFHIYMTIWTASLKNRFSFGPSDHGKFMSFIGLTYALSQGVVAKRVVKPLGPTGRIRILQVCCLALGLGRYFAFKTTSLLLVYVIFALIITALGIMNTVLTGDAATLASSDEVGGLYGVLEAVESTAGVVGPLIGGMLASLVDPVESPLAAVIALYFHVFLLVSFGYERLILSQQVQPAKKAS